jgi:hypothetical protein
MYSCPLHNWNSHDAPCPSCQTTVTTAGELPALPVEVEKQIGEGKCADGTITSQEIIELFGEWRRMLHCLGNITGLGLSAGVDKLIEHASKPTPSVEHREPPTDLQERANEYADKVHPFVWPKNKHGEDMVQVVGASQPPFSKKHRKEQAKIIAAYLSGASSTLTGGGREIEFAEWISNNQFTRYNGVWTSTKIHYSPDKYTTSELYSLFLKTR